MIIVSTALFIWLIDSGVSELSIALRMIVAVISIISSGGQLPPLSARSSQRAAKRNESRGSPESRVGLPTPSE